MDLIAHPDHPPHAVTGIAATAVRNGDRLALTYTVSGDVTGLQVAPGTGRTDELWRRTCFEAFVQATGPEYVEYNFAPSGAWAAYGFDDRREGMRDISAAPRVAWDGRTLAAEVAVPVAGDWRVNLTTVLVEADGTLSWWASAHAAGPPDFHDPGSRVVGLPA